MELVPGGNLAQRIYSPSKRRLEYWEVRCNTRWLWCKCRCTLS